MRELAGPSQQPLGETWFEAGLLVAGAVAGRLHQELFEAWIECQHADLACARREVVDDGPTQADADALHQLSRA